MNILIVEDNVKLAIFVSELLNHEAMNPHVTANGKEALSVLFSTNIDLVITDLRMPLMDGFELISHMGKDFPTVPIIVMTGVELKEIRADLVRDRLFPILRKPFKPQKLLDLVYEEMKRKESGYIKRIGLGSFLQLLQLERQSTVLRVTSRGRKGFLFLVKGELANARTGTVLGESAVREIMKWEDVEISLLDITMDGKITVRSNLTKILLDSALEQDNTSKG